MRPPASRSRFAIFCCPVCHRDLALSERALRCANGHSFDLAKSGYVNLAPARRHAPASGGDVRPQLERRAHFLAKGHFDFIAEAIAIHVEQSETILDAGCGTGFHLARLAGQLGAPMLCGIDLSKDAAAWCAKRYPQSDFAVADIWSGQPVRSNSVDLVTSIFAPKNFVEIARVLRPGGMLAMAFPGAQHFRELRRDFDLLGLSDKKIETYAARIAAHFALLAHRRITRRAAFDHDDLWNAILMGPNARHLIAAREGPAKMSVTIDIEFLFARKPHHWAAMQESRV